MFIREAEENDLDELACLFGELGYRTTRPDPRSQVTVYIDAEDCRLLVAQTGEGNLSGLIAGHVFPLIHQPGNVGRIMALVVGERFRSQGVGSLLLESLEAWFSEKNCNRFEVNSGDHRDRAHKFYEAKGYRVDERRFIKSGDTLRGVAAGLPDGRPLNIGVRRHHGISDK